MGAPRSRLRSPPTLDSRIWRVYGRAMHPRAWLVGAITGVVVLVSASSALAVEAPTCSDITTSTTANHATQVSFGCTGPGPITYSTTSTPAHGSLNNLNSSAGTVTYTPNAAYSGPASFNYNAHN